MQSKRISLDAPEILKDAVNKIHPFLGEILNGKEGTKPVVILDNVHFVSDPDGMATIALLAEKWKEVILILIGDTMDNALLKDFHEFRIGPWVKQA